MGEKERGWDGGRSAGGGGGVKKGKKKRNNGIDWGLGRTFASCDWNERLAPADGGKAMEEENMGWKVWRGKRGSWRGRGWGRGFDV